MSLRVRVFGLTVLLFVGGLMAAGALIPELVRGFLIDRVDDELVGVGLAAIGELRSPVDRPADVEPFDDADAVGPRPQGGYFQILDADGEVIESGFVGGDESGRQAPYVPADITSSPPNNVITTGGTGAGSPTSYRLAVIDPPSPATTPDPSLPSALTPFDDVTIVAAVPLTEVDDVIGRIVFVEIAVGMVVVALVAAGSWWLVGVGLRPLRRMEETVESIRTEGFAESSRADPTGRRPRVDHPANRTEIGRLGETLNGMLDEIDDAFERQVASESKLRRFVTDASHELRTPLTSIRGYAQLLARSTGDGDRSLVTSSVGRIERESVRMTALIDDMLTVARLDEEPSLRITPVDIASLVRHLAADARAADPGRKVTVSTPVVLVAHADSARVAQAVLNLLTNARIHTPPDQPIEIDARRDVEGHGIVVSVADHGPGIAADERHRVFDRFTRLDQGRSRAQGGSGLGLAIVASIAHAHGGTVTAGDTDGGGATFTLTLPDTARPDGCATEFEHGGATTE